MKRWSLPLALFALLLAGIAPAHAEIVSMQLLGVTPDKVVFTAPDDFVRNLRGINMVLTPLSAEEQQKTCSTAELIDTLHDEDPAFPEKLNVTEETFGTLADLATYLNTHAQSPGSTSAYNIGYYLCSTQASWAKTVEEGTATGICLDPEDDNVALFMGCFATLMSTTYVTVLEAAK